MRLPPGWTLYPGSVVELDRTAYALARSQWGEKRLAIAGDARGFDGAPEGATTLCPLTAANAAQLRKRLPWCSPQPLGLRLAAGTGDRLGLATPGHVRAVRRFGLAPVYAQQSMRENARTGRSPQNVLDDAMWGLFQEGWREPWGADADHLKTTDDVDVCVDAGYTFYTFDPGAHVDNEAHTAPLEVLRRKWAGLPWAELDDSPDGQAARYVGRRFLAESFALEFSETALLRAACKYGRAIAHVAHSYRHLATRIDQCPFEVEVSVDETETPTSPREHWFVASELQRLGVRAVSLAPRYVGRFEKGVDYIGDLAELEREVAQHAAIARTLGPYKLSLHSGSDKFSVYPVMVRQAGSLVHLKTAGTSYLEALRAVAGIDAALFREILALAHERYPVDRATYHVSADLARVPEPAELADGELASVLDTFDGREALHVTFGSALDRFGSRLKELLAANEEAHYAALEAHFVKHLAPFAPAME